MSTLDLERICRLCCTIKGDMRALFEQRQEYPLALSQMIYAIVDLKVDANDGLPQKICSQCVTSLTKMYTTIQSYRENDLILRKQLDQAKSDEIANMVEIEEMSLKQEVGTEGWHGSEPLSRLKPINNIDEDETKDAAADEEGTSTELNIFIKNEPLNECDEQSQLNVTDQYVDVCEQTVVRAHRKPTAVQECEPITKPKRGIQQSTTKDPNQSRVPLDEHGEEDQFDPDWVLLDEDNEESDVSDHSEAADVWEPKQSKTKDPKPAKFRRGKTKAPYQLKLRSYKCYVCKSESHKTATALLLHLTSNHMHMLPFTCSECVLETVVLNTVLGLNKHLRGHFYPKECPYCDESFATKSQVDLHIQALHPSKEDNGAAQISLKCKHCSREYPSKDSLRRHLRNMHAPVTCTICGAILNGCERLRYHRQNEHDRHSGKFDCSICQKKLSSLRTLQYHLAAFHSNPTQRFKCSYCPKAYSTIVARKVHERQHVCNPNYKAKKSWVQYYTFLDGQQGVRKKTCKCNICGKVTKKIVEHLQKSHFKIKGEQSKADTVEKRSCKEDRTEAVTGDGGLAETSSKSGRPRRSLRSK